MKNLIQKSFISAFLLAAYISTRGQDIHYSQFESSPLNLNPAQCGDFEGDFRITGNERTQWRSITVPYQTFSASFDAGFSVPVLSLSSFGAGLLFNSDKAGDSEFGTTQVKLALAWHQDILGDKSLIASAGIDVGYYQNSINYNDLYFGSQYTGNRFEPDMPHDEVFVEDHLSYFDFTMGAAIRYVIGENIPVTAGIAFTHINRPEKSFYDNSLIELDRKFNFYGMAEIPVNDNVELLPSLLFMNQGKFRETDAGGLVRLKTSNAAFHHIYFGGWMRLKDAGIVKFAIDYRDLTLGFSYDINTSSLRVASAGQGGLEISLIYILSRARKVPAVTKKQCPGFL